MLIFRRLRALANAVHRLGCAIFLLLIVFAVRGHFGRPSRQESKTARQASAQSPTDAKAALHT